MREHGLTDLFRFILTHADMDHMDGIKEVFEQCNPANFWDTDNNETKEFSEDSRYNEDDWQFYLSLRDGRPDSNPRRLTLYSGAIGQYYNRGEQNEPGGDGLSILAPTSTLVAQANESGDYNDSSYVVLYRTNNHRILFAGDSHDATWEHILSNYESSVKNVDVLIAPHHGRASDRSYDFLDTVNPALTLFGNANSEHLAYAAWNNRKLTKITNNQAGSILIDAEGPVIHVYVTCQKFAAQSTAFSFASPIYKGYHYWGAVQRQQAISA
jgi:competence protein ComEC